LKIVCFFALLGLSLPCSSAQTPIPSRPDGFAFGGPLEAPIILEGFFDVLCPDCAAGWPTVKKVVAHYGNNLRLIVHTFPLPYHTWAFIANQGIHVVAQASGNNMSAVHAYYDLFFGGVQELYWNDVVVNNSTVQIVASMGQQLERAGLISAANFTAGIQNDDLNMDTRISWKYSCSRAVTGTPTFLINGVYTSADDTYTEQDWYNLIDPLLNAQKERQMRKNPFWEAGSLAPPSCPNGQTLCVYAKGKSECCLAGESCIPNVGCRC